MMMMFQSWKILICVLMIVHLPKNLTLFQLVIFAQMKWIVCLNSALKLIYFRVQMKDFFSLKWSVNVSNWNAFRKMSGGRWSITLPDTSFDIHRWKGYAGIISCSRNLNQSVLVKSESSRQSCRFDLTKVWDLQPGIILIVSIRRPVSS